MARIAGTAGIAGTAEMTGMAGMADGGDLQGYIWHCHLLDHEDHEMMLRYRLVDE